MPESTLLSSTSVRMQVLVIADIPGDERGSVKRNRETKGLLMVQSSGSSSEESDSEESPKKSQIAS
jgi:hypothetical protein